MDGADMDRKAVEVIQRLKFSILKIATEERMGWLVLAAMFAFAGYSFGLTKNEYIRVEIWQNNSMLGYCPIQKIKNNEDFICQMEGGDAIKLITSKRRTPK